MSFKQIDVFEADYDRLVIQAGDRDKIKFIISALLKLQTATERDLIKLEAWVDAAKSATQQLSCLKVPETQEHSTQQHHPPPFKYPPSQIHMPLAHLP